MRLLLVSCLAVAASAFSAHLGADDKSNVSPTPPLLSSSSSSDPLADLSFSSSSLSDPDPCASVSSRLRCLRVRKCSDKSKPIATIDGYWLTNTPSGTYKKPSQHTNVTICYDENSGLHIAEAAADRHAFTPYTACNSYVWQRSSALELMIFPVKTPHDVPRFYYEIDLTPSGATYGSMIYNAKGNVSNCATCKAGELKCSGANVFPDAKGMKLSARYTYDPKTGAKIGWSTSRFLPFSMFFELQGKTKMFKFNFYRYGYPNGPSGAYELSGYSPTWNPSFHIPDRFALMVLV